MIFFLATQDFQISTGSITQQFLAAPHPDLCTRNPPDRLYCTTVSDLKKLEDRCLASGNNSLTKIVPEEYVRTVAGFPMEVGVSNYGELTKELALANRLDTPDGAAARATTADLKKQVARITKPEIKVAVLNGVGTGIGDTIVGLTALAEVYQVLQQQFRKVTLDALVDARRFPSVAPLYEQSPIINTVYSLPVTLDTLRRYDLFFDTGSLMHRPDADRLPYVDFFLKQFGINYRKAAITRKRNRLRLDKQATEEIAGALKALPIGDRKLLLFHPQASSALRSVPEDRIAPLLQGLIDNSEYQIVTVLPVPFTHERVTNLAELSRSLQHYCAIVSLVDAIVTVDTSIYHIADSFDIPTVVLFTSIDPTLRVKYYPFVSPILLAGARDTHYFGKHYLLPDLPLEPVLRLWDSVDARQILAELARLAKKTSR